MNRAGMAVRLAAAGLVLLAVAAGQPAQATQLVYVPANPAFGGSPLAGSALLATAQATNKHKDPAGASSSLNKSPLQQFSDMLERSVLSQLSSAATAGVIANGKLKPGTVETGDFRIDIVDAGGGVLIVTTTDKVTGQSTSFQVGGN